MEAKFIHPFLTATVNVLKTMASLDPKPGKPFMKDNKDALGDVSGIIGLTGASKGALIVSFSKACALKVISAMLMEEFTEINEEVKDGIGEITNMISGDARRQLEGIGMEFQAGIPTVISGKNHEISSIYNGLTSCLVIPFTCDGLDFYVEAIFSAK